MSPVAVAGPPHNRSTLINGNGPVVTMDGSKAGAVGGSRGTSRIFAHLEDLTSVKPEVDINWPIRKILQDAELLAKQADTHLDFRRPDIALQEFIKSYILATETIPRHKEYPSLSSSQSEINRSYMGLLKRIKAQQGRFEEAKRVIQEDNERSGVLPLLSGTGEKGNVRAINGASSITNGIENGDHANGTAKSSLPNGSANGPTTRKKPPIQPKPDALHGKAFQSAITTSSTSDNSDLASRFARLRSPAPFTPQQDPRIRTQPITIPTQSENNIKSPTTSKPTMFPTAVRPLGPREMPSVPTTALGTDLPLNTQVPRMPKPPDAIYSPSRNPDTAATINFPTSIPRSSSYIGNGNNAAPPVSTVGRTPSSDGRQEYFSPAHKASDIDPPRQNPILPNTTTVSANELTKYLRMGSQTLRILLVDVRSREEFDEGHIMSPSIICIEPVTLRAGISSEELLESLVLSPESELTLYEERHECDLVVFYDQRSFSLKGSDSQANNSSSYLQNFAKAMYEYGYDKQLKRRPMLLLGGLDAWADLMGPSSLQSSSTSGSSSSKASRVNGTKSGRPLGRTPIVRDAHRFSAARRRNYQSRPLSKEEESKWDETMKEHPIDTSPTPIEEDGSDDFSYVRTTEDFFRRYPELPSVQESMISARPAPRKAALQDVSINLMSKPPARPAPALPRQRSSGVVEKTLVASYAMGDGEAWAPTTLSKEARSVGGLTGLHNPGQHCYGVTIIQCFSASGQFRDYLLNFHVGPDTSVPRKPNESTDPPQLLVRNLGNLLGHMWSGHYDYVKPTTFMAYVNAVHMASSEMKQPKHLLFGGPNRQHDASEFMIFLINILHDELNKFRDRPDYQAQTKVAASKPGFNDLSISELKPEAAIRQEWKRILGGSNSEYSKLFHGMEAALGICHSCGFVKKNFLEFPYLKVDFPPAYTMWGSQMNKVTLTDMLKDAFNSPQNTMDDYLCPSCKTRGDGHLTRALAYMPDYLILDFPRFQALQMKPETDASGKTIGTPQFKSGKVLSRIEFGETINFDSAFLQGGSHAQPGDTAADRGHVGPFVYDVYAIIIHVGTQIKSGHYFAMTRSLDKPGHDSSSWHQFNDTHVEETEFKKCQLTKTTDGQVTNLFLKRRQRA